MLQIMAKRYSLQHIKGEEEGGKVNGLGRGPQHHDMDRQKQTLVNAEVNTGFPHYPKVVFWEISRMPK